MDKAFSNLARRITPDDLHYFFGYFDKCPWNSRGDHPAHRIDFAGRQPRFGEAAEIGFLRDGVFHPVGETRAWCWQQGCMLQWFDDERLIWNDLEHGDHHVARLSDGTVLPRPVYTLSRDRRFALTLNFSRLDTERPGYGYPGVADPSAEYAFPEDDGVFLMDLRNREIRLVVPLARLVNEFPASGADTAVNWVNHLLFNPSGTRFAFIHRWRVFGPWGRGRRSYVTRMFTAKIDGSDLRMLPIDFHASHYTWSSDEQLIIFSRLPRGGDQYRIYSACDDTPPQIFARDRLPANGHCSFSPDGKLLLTDSYTNPDGTRELVVYRAADDTRFSLGNFVSPAILQASRCDLHPRWSQDGRRISFDSFHETHRGIYTIDLPREVLC